MFIANDAAGLRRADMSFVLFLRGFIGALAVFAVVTYVATQSLLTTLIDTAVCAVIIQVGYFLAVLVMVRRSPQQSKAEARRQEPATAAKKDRQAAR